MTLTSKTYNSLPLILLVLTIAGCGVTQKTDTQNSGTQNSGTQNSGTQNSGTQNSNADGDSKAIRDPRQLQFQRRERRQQSHATVCRL